nr:helix-turn-helix domain-containing protein [Novosphingobium sp. ERN07]
MVLAEVLLGNYCNSYSEQIALHGNDISPRHVRRAREIIHQSLDDNISINALAAQVGVSVRSLQNGFRDFLGLTPLEYVRRHRLERLHSALMNACGETSVTELMLECGIVNFGRYAQYYRQQYGCLPSETLRRRV